MINNYYVYILASKKNGTLYIGVTNSLERRTCEHKAGMNQGFTKRYDVRILVYYENLSNIDDAIRREKTLKSWNRAWKISLIESFNPNWDDLFDRYD